MKIKTKLLQICCVLFVYFLVAASTFIFASMVLRMEISQERFWVVLRPVEAAGIILSFFLIVFVLWEIFIMNRKLIRPLESLIHGTKEIADGNFDVVVDDTIDNELGIIGRSFNEMANRLKHQYETLDKEINDRTRELAASLERQKSLLSAIPDIVTEVDKDKIYRWMNHAGMEFFGDDVIGKPADFYFEGEQDTYEIIQPIFSKDENVVYVESLQRRKDGEKRLLAWWCRGLKDAEGKTVGAISSARDITECRNTRERLAENIVILAEEKAKDEAILASIGDGIVVTNSSGSGKIVLLNEAAEKMIGLQPGEAIGKSFYDVFILKDKDGNVLPIGQQPLSEVLLRGKSVKTSEYFYTKNGKETFPVSITVTPVILDGKTLGSIEIFRDFTNEKKIDLAKDEFISLASHQLRTPVTSIRWYSEALLDGKSGALDEKKKRYLEEIYQSNVRMSDLIDTLLVVSHIQAGNFPVSLKRVDVTEILERSIRDFGPRIQEKGISIDEKCKCGELFIETDPSLVLIILQNLIGNSVEYTFKGGSISLCVKKDNSDIIFEIHDNGCGIPSVDQPRIFEKFFRASNANIMRSSGTGLGLYITKMIVEVLKGDIRFESKENEGTTFWVTLPNYGADKRTP